MLSGQKRVRASVKREVARRPEEELKLEFPMAGIVEGWFFRVDEVSAGAYLAEGIDVWGRRVSCSGTDPDELLERCVKDAREIQAGLGQ